MSAYGRSQLDAFPAAGEAIYEPEPQAANAEDEEPEAWRPVRDALAIALGELSDAERAFAGEATSESLTGATGNSLPRARISSA